MLNVDWIYLCLTLVLFYNLKHILSNGAVIHDAGHCLPCTSHCICQCDSIDIIL